MRIGSLFSGYGGLEEGVRAVLGGSVAWHAEIDPAPATVLAYQLKCLGNGVVPQQAALALRLLLTTDLDGAS